MADRITVNAPQMLGSFHPDCINHDEGLIRALVVACIEAMEDTTYDDGTATASTSGMEALERALHNVYQPYRPSYPDSATSLACIYQCEWCKQFDANRKENSNG
jgi:hypothetical protein